ncbi:MAG: histidine kinase dimerization/phospho-acceptor domain-containing protein, partial [Thermosynechococcaceae cyanobacterium]
AQDRAISSPNIHVEPLLQPSISATKPLEMKSMLAVRTSYQGKANGAIVLQHCDIALSRQDFLSMPQVAQDRLIRQWTPEEIELLEAVADQVGIALAQAEMLEKEKQQGHELSYKNSALQQAMKEAEQANLTRTLFLGSMSHELRTPLNGVLGYAQLLQKTSELSPENQQQVRGIRESGEQLLELIDDLLDLSTLETQKIELEPTHVHFPNFLGHLSDICQPKAHQKGIDFITKFHPDLPLDVSVDQKRLRQILVNLLSDAIKRTTEGCVTLTVIPLPSECIVNQDFLSQGYPDIQRIRFQISDTSDGTHLKELPNIFLPFQYVEKATLQHVGVGLGLAVSQKIATLMGCEIQIQDATQSGTLCSVDLDLSVIPMHENASSQMGNIKETKIDDEISPDICAQNLMLPPLDTLIQLDELAKKGMIYELRDQIKIIEDSDCKFQCFCQEIAERVERFQIKQIKLMLQGYINNRYEPQY